MISIFRYHKIMLEVFFAIINSKCGIFEYHKIIFEYHKIIFEYHKIIFEYHKIIFEYHKIIFEYHKFEIRDFMIAKNRKKWQKWLKNRFYDSENSILEYIEIPVWRQLFFHF